MKRQVKDNRKRNAEIYKTIAAAISITDCDTTPIMRLLGNTEGVGEHNILLCFTQLDIKITEIKCERDRLKELKSNNTNVTTYSKPVLTKTNKAPQSFGGPYVPKVLMVHAESVEDEDSKIFEQEPYYYDEMKEYVFQKMVEDKIIDPVQRALSVSQKKDYSSSDKSSSRKTLIDKIRQSQMEDPGLRTKQKLLEKMAGDGAGSDETEKSSTKSATISKSSKEEHGKLDKKSSKGKSTASAMSRSEMTIPPPDENYPPPEDDSASLIYDADYRHVNTPATDYDGNDRYE